MEGAKERLEKKEQIEEKQNEQERNVEEQNEQEQNEQEQNVEERNEQERNVEEQNEQEQNEQERNVEERNEEEQNVEERNEQERNVEQQNEEGQSETVEDEDEKWDLARYPLAERAFDKAKEGLAAGEVPIGCVFAYFPDEASAQDKPLQPVIIAESYNSPNHTRNPTRHAEINAIEIAMEWAEEHNIPQTSLWRRTSVIVTVEPCVMCASALLSLGVRHVRFGCNNFRFGGCGSVVDVPGVFGPKPEDAGCSTKVSTTFVGGWRGAEAVMLMKEFYKGENPNAPPGKGRKKRGNKKGAATTESEATK